MTDPVGVVERAREVKIRYSAAWRTPRPPAGRGYLSSSFPDFLTTVDGVPVSATVRILHRPLSGAPGDGVVVAEVQSAPDGTWRVDGLNPALRFDVIGHLDGKNDVIMANICPVVD